MHRNFDYMKTEALCGLQAAVKCRRFDGNGVARTGHALQSETQCFESPGGDDNLFDADRHPQSQISLGNLLPKVDASGRETLDGTPRI
jgi:hypothetical protein